MKSEDDLDLSNEDVVMKVLENGTGGQLETLRKVKNFTQRQLFLACYYVGKRRDIIQKMYNKIEVRKAINPILTEEELNLGTYIECLEPQVAKAVLRLRKKGYNTKSSGFWTFSQSIHFTPDTLKDFIFSDSVRISVAQRGATIRLRSNYIAFDCETELSNIELESIWLLIEAAFPSLGKHAEPCQSNGAKSFREKHAK